MGKYRVKVLNELTERYLKEILSACDLKLRQDGKIYLIGADPGTPPLSVKEGQVSRTLLFVNSEELFVKYLNDTDTLKAFNPFVNINHLQYLCEAIVINFINAVYDPNDSRLFDVEGDLRQELDISKLVDVKRLLKDQDGNIEYNVLKFDIDDPGRFDIVVKAKCSNSLSALLLCFLKMSKWINSGKERMEKMFLEGDEKWDNEINDLLDKYEKERRLNARDLKKEKKEQNFIKHNNLDIDYSGKLDVLNNMMENGINRDVEYIEDNYDGIQFR